MKSKPTPAPLFTLAIACGAINDYNAADQTGSETTQRQTIRFPMGIASFSDRVVSPV